MVIIYPSDDKYRKFINNSNGKSNPPRKK